MKVNRRETASREEKPMIGSTKGGEIDKITDMGRNHRLTRT
jgi:hypothetical protein